MVVAGVQATVTGDEVEEGLAVDVGERTAATVLEDPFDVVEHIEIAEDRVDVLAEAAQHLLAQRLAFQRGR